MKSVFAILALCIAFAAGGSVPYERCGGVGTAWDVRMESCGLVTTCELTPGTAYVGEIEFTPAAASPALRLKVTTFFIGDVVIVDAELPGSSVQPGIVYTATYTIVPNDVLSGNTLPIRAELSHIDSGLVEVCVGSQIKIA